MSDYTYPSLQLVARHVPDYSTERDENDNKYRVELPGHFEIGTELDGQFVEIARVKAGNLLKKIAQAKQAQQQPASQEG